MPQLWPWVKVMERSSSTYPQIHIFFVPNIKGLARKTNWKHKVTPDRGDLISLGVLTTRYSLVFFQIKEQQRRSCVGVQRRSCEGITTFLWGYNDVPVRVQRRFCEGTTTFLWGYNDVPVRVQRRYCEGPVYTIMNSYSLIPGWNLCIYYVKLVSKAPGVKIFICALLICVSLQTF